MQEDLSSNITRSRPHLCLLSNTEQNFANTVDQIESAFTDAGLNVARNAPFAGAYVAQTYGRPTRQQHAIQIEIDRSLYMDEDTIQPNGNFQSFREVLRQVSGKIASIGSEPLSLAAE